MTAKAPQPMPEGAGRTNRPKAPSAPPKNHIQAVYLIMRRTMVGFL